MSMQRILNAPTRDFAVHCCALDETVAFFLQLGDGFAHGAGTQFRFKEKHF